MVEQLLAGKMAQEVDVVESLVEKLVSWKVEKKVAQLADL
jgi:hypothetical protein